jgi:ABC-type multidrug transport system fused ATPase/permease subunit
LAPPVLIGTAVDVVVKKQDSVIARLGITDIFGQFLILAFFTVIVWVLESVFEYAYKRLWRNLSQQIQHNLRLDAYNHLLEKQGAYAKLWRVQSGLKVTLPKQSGAKLCLLRHLNPCHQKTNGAIG